MAFQRDEFGRELRALLAQRQLSYREVQRRTGVSFSQVGDLCRGVVRTRAQVEKLIAGLELDTSEWLLRAGFVPPNLDDDVLAQALTRLGDVVRLSPGVLARPSFERVSAGSGVLPPDTCLGPTTDSLAPFDYTVRVRGDSMSGVLEDGDLAFIKAQCQAQPGDLVVALVHDAAVVKRLRCIDGQETLVSTSEHYERIPAAEARILGVVTGYYRRP